MSVVLISIRKLLADILRIYSIGKGNQVQLMDFIINNGESLGVPFKYNFLPAQKGGVAVTYADTADLKQLGCKVETLLGVGMPKFIKCFKGYYKK